MPIAVSVLGCRRRVKRSGEVAGLSGVPNDLGERYRIEVPRGWRLGGPAASVDVRGEA
jgi:hypothetical protein